MAKFRLKCVKIYLLAAYFQQVLAHIKICHVQLTTCWALCVNCKTPRYVTNASETVTNDVLSIYDQKYAKNTQISTIASSHVCAYLFFANISKSKGPRA